MKKAYFLMHGGGYVGKSLVKSWADNSPLVITWRTEMQGAFFVISEASAEELYTDLRASVPSIRTFIFVEAHTNRQGLLSKESWHLLRHKEPKPK
jgi:hypothetical protein